MRFSGCRTCSPLNPQKLPAVTEHLAFNTAASFTTNTNWQSYGGESTMSYLSQMVALAIHNFFSAAVGIAIAAALVRGIARHTAKTIGNFWVDLVRVHLLPAAADLSDLRALPRLPGNDPELQAVRHGDADRAFHHAGPEGRRQRKSRERCDGKPVMVDQKVDTQTIVQGPMASQVAIKMLGTNGGGYVNANAAHPFENPTPLSNFLQMLSIFAIPSALTYYLGRMVKNQGHGWAVWAAMFVLFVAGVLICWHYEAAGNPIMQQLGVDPADGNMEGKEVRFGIFNSALFATITTDASCGAVNSMHDSFTPLGGLVPLLNIQLGEVVFGGVGAGLYGMLVYRRPRRLHRRPDGRANAGVSRQEDRALRGEDGVVCHSHARLFHSWFFRLGQHEQMGRARRDGPLTDGTNNSGPHGFSEILYAYSSGTGNNGSAFAGLERQRPVVQHYPRHSRCSSAALP